jgi:hypothetical protein
MSEQPRPLRVNISAQDLDDIIRNELYELQARFGADLLPSELVRSIAKKIVRMALSFTQHKRGS